ncbi:MAG: hypothetical protein ACI9JL_002155 [Paracoccaceae bacterium]|jgi:hypothetical protein
MLKKLIAVASVATAIGLAQVSVANAAQFTISTSQVCGDSTCSVTGNSYVGAGGNTVLFSTNNQGTVSDGGYDAYDWMGGIDGLSGLTHTRRTETFAANNIYRWIETFTNNTASQISTNIRYFGDLGSDGSTTVNHNAAGFAVTSDGVNSDPVIAHVFGNNAFAASNMNFATGVPFPGQGQTSFLPDNLMITAALTVNAGETVRLAYFDFLARDTSNRSGDLALALSTGANLQANPFFTGLTANEISSIVNFGEATEAPEPASLAILCLGLVGLGYARRKRAA